MKIGQSCDGLIFLMGILVLFPYQYRGSILKTRMCHICLIFIMGIPVPEKSIFIDTGPAAVVCQWGEFVSKEETGKQKCDSRLNPSFVS